MVTYQVVYWLWLKLETDEIKYLKNGMRSLAMGEAVALAFGYPAKRLTRLTGEIKSLEAELKKAKSAR